MEDKQYSIKFTIVSAVEPINEFVCGVTSLANEEQSKEEQNFEVEVEGEVSKIAKNVVELMNDKENGKISNDDYMSELGKNWRLYSKIVEKNDKLSKSTQNSINNTDDVPIKPYKVNTSPLFKGSFEKEVDPLLLAAMYGELDDDKIGVDSLKELVGSDNIQALSPALSSALSENFTFSNMNSREGLIDQAIRTAESGYIRRKLNKCVQLQQLDCSDCDNITDQSINELIQLKQLQPMECVYITGTVAQIEPEDPIDTSTGSLLTYNISDDDSDSDSDCYSDSSDNNFDDLDVD